jgi:heptosyltransferase II
VKILVRGTNWIGDAVMSVPALRELRRIFPDAHITLHTADWADGLFGDAQFLDELVTFKRSKWRIKDVYDNWQFLQDDSFDLAILFPNSFESALTAFLTRIPRRFGYNKDLRELLLTDPIAVPEWKDRRHEVFYYLNLIAEVEKRVLGRETVSEALPDVSLDITGERQTSAKQILNGAGINGDKKIVALGVGSTNSRAKRWPAESYAALNDMLQTRSGANVVLIGSKDESSVASHVISLSDHKPIDLTGQTNLSEAVATLGSVDLLISNDMGLAHVADAVGTPTLIIFGPTDPTTTRPYSSNAEVIRKKVECAPCMLRDCPIDHRCMTRITVEEVWAAAKRRLTPFVDDLEDETSSIS